MHTFADGIKKTVWYDRKNHKKTEEGQIMCEILALIIISKNYIDIKEIFRNEFVSNETKTALENIFIINQEPQEGEKKMYMNFMII